MSLATALTALDTQRDNLAANLTTKGVTASNTETLAQLVPKVLNIESGGGTPTVVTPKDVNFYDYDGVCLYAYTLAEAQALTALPSAPDHSSDTTPLTFQKWNYTLAQVNATTSALDVGATYITADGKTHLYITLTAVSGLAPTLYLNKSDGSTLTVAWGDSTSNTFTNSGNFNTGAHTYSAAGNYTIKMWISSGTGTYGFGNASVSTVVVGGGTAVYQQAISKCFVGANVTSIGASAFNSCYSLTSITIPSGVTSIAASAFQSCFPLASIIIPSGVTSIGSSAFNSCCSLTSIIIPSGVTSIAASAFQNCYSLTSIIIPSGVTSIAAGAFQSCFAIKFYQIKATTPPTLSATSAFTGIVSICKIRVPSASLSAYQAATNWSTYANYMVGF